MIVEDVRFNGESSMTDIQNRLPEVTENDVKKAVYHLVEKGELEKIGAKKNRTYGISKKKNK